MNRRRILFHSGVWVVVLALITFYAGQRAAENSRQRAASAEWHAMITKLTTAGLKQRDALVARIRELHGQPNSRQLAVTLLPWLWGLSLAAFLLVPVAQSDCG